MIERTSNYLYCPCKVPAFKSRFSVASCTDDMGWRGLVKGPLDIHVLPGDHYSLIKDPEVQRLVKELSTCIDRALSKHAVEAV